MCGGARPTTQSPHLLPGAVWRDAGKTVEWATRLDRARPIVVACKAGHEMSQMRGRAVARATAIDARVLEGGYEGWAKAGLPFVAKAGARPHRAEAARASG